MYKVSQKLCELGCYMKCHSVIVLTSFVPCYFEARFGMRKFFQLSRQIKVLMSKLHLRFYGLRFLEINFQEWVNRKTDATIR
jgi:hypothetical protein